MDMASKLMDFILNLLRDDEALQKFQADSQAQMAEAGVAEATQQDLDDAWPAVMDHCKPVDTGAHVTTAVAAGSVGGTHYSAVDEQINHVATSYEVDDRDVVANNSFDNNDLVLGSLSNESDQEADQEIVQNIDQSQEVNNEYNVNVDGDGNEVSIGGTELSQEANPSAGQDSDQESDLDGRLEQISTNENSNEEEDPDDPDNGDGGQPDGGSPTFNFNVEELNVEDSFNESTSIEDSFNESTTEVENSGEGDVNLDQSETTVNDIDGDQVGGDKVVNDIEGDQVGGDDIEGDQVGGDQVGGDQVGGDKITDSTVNSNNDPGDDITNSNNDPGDDITNSNNDPGDDTNQNIENENTQEALVGVQDVADLQVDDTLNDVVDVTDNVTSLTGDAAG